MTKVFLGYPPESIRQWIENNRTPAEPAKTWVEACNPDGSLLSDIEHAEWVFSDGEEHVITYDDITTLTMDNGLTADMSQMFFEDGTRMSDVPEPWNLSEDELLEFRGKVVVARYDELNVTAYRKYTPGHWEDTETGEWTDGSWGDWNTNFVSNGIVFLSMEEMYGYGNNEKNWWMSVDNEGDFIAMAYPSATNKNATTLWYEGFIATRTWTSTKPAPVA